MSNKIIDAYNFMVAPAKTKWRSEFDAGDKGGYCPMDCINCPAYTVVCDGCDLKCLDINCRGYDCYRCPFLCHRGGKRLNEALNAIGGLEIDKTPTIDTYFDIENRYIPAYNKSPHKSFNYPIISIPFYAIYDFVNQKPLCTDVHEYLKIPLSTKIIINFYFKDDKIMMLFDYMMDGKFIDLLRHYKGVSYWHTPCFSVYRISSSMDCVLNFKRQFWIGDIMRDAGFNTIQEVLYSTQKEYIKASPSVALDVIVSKGIKKISQCAQLNFFPDETLLAEMGFIRKLPKEIAWILTGVNNKVMDSYLSLRKNMYFANYAPGYRYDKTPMEYINETNNNLKEV